MRGNGHCSKCDKIIKDGDPIYRGYNTGCSGHDYKLTVFDGYKDTGEEWKSRPYPWFCENCGKVTSVTGLKSTNPCKFVTSVTGCTVCGKISS